MSIANDMLSDAAQNKMLKTVAPVSNHYNQVYSKLVSRPHDISIRHACSDIDNTLPLILEGVLDN